MNLKIIILAFFCMSMVACKEEFNKPTEEDAAITGKVSNVTVENTPGGAVLTYTIPSDASLLYVLAELKNKRGVTRQFKAAQFTNKINIDGLGDTDTYKVTLYAVNKSEMRSEPITVEINPLKPPFLTVFETVQIREDFGGVNVKFKNDTEAEVGVVLYATDSLGNYKQYGSFYTQSKDVNYTFRGMKDVDTKVGAFIKDRWDNTSDTLTKNLKPLNEIMMDKAKFKDITLPTDAKIYQGLSYISKHFMYDGRWSTVFSNPYNPGLSMTTDMSGAKQPLHVTFDMGVKARLSRVRISNYYQYQNRTMRKYEIWGHPGTPPSDGSWDGWIKMGEHEQIKPSGLPLGQYSEDDKRAWEAGDNFNLLSEAPPIRYIRIRCLLNWQGDSNMAIAEITLWGSTQISE